MAGRSRAFRVRTLNYAIRIDSTIRTFPLTGPIRPNALQLCSIFDIENCLSSMPNSLLAGSNVQSISILDTDYRDNKKMSENTGGKSTAAFAVARAATGQIEFFRNNDCSWIRGENGMINLSKKMCHELTHLFDSHVGRVQTSRKYHGISFSGDWRAAVGLDQCIHHGDLYLTDYAQSYSANAEIALSEDFAESVSCFFFLDSYTVWMIKNCPNRVTILRHLFPEAEARIRKFDK